MHRAATCKEVPFKDDYFKKKKKKRTLNVIYHLYNLFISLFVFCESRFKLSLVSCTVGLGLGSDLPLNTST